jgi:hypothetical protein
MHPRNKHALLSTLLHRAKALCDQGNLHAKLVSCGTATPSGILSRTSFNPPPRIAQPDDKPDSVTFLPYVGSIFNHCCLATTSSLWASLPREYLVSFGRPRTVWDCKHRKYTASLVRAGRSTLRRRRAVRLTPGCRGTSYMSG